MRNREQLLRFLKEREKDGLGGLTMIEVIDSVPKSDRVIKVSNRYRGFPLAGGPWTGYYMPPLLF